MPPKKKRRSPGAGAAPPPPPPGPQALAEFLEWPTLLVRRMLDQDPAAAAAWATFAKSGFDIHSDFSGMMGPECALKLMQMAWQEAGVAVPEDMLSFHRATDINAVSQEIMMASDAQHVFNSVTERVAIDGLKEYRPASDASSAQKERDYSSMCDWLERNRSSCFPAAGTQRCLRHNKQCPTTAGPSKGRTRMAMAGTLCTPFTNQGTRSGLAHEGMESFYCWRSEVEEACMDIIALENSDLFPAASLWNPKGYTQINFIFSPSDPELIEHLLISHIVCGGVAGLPAGLGRRRRGLCKSASFTSVVKYTSGLEIDILDFL